MEWESSHLVLLVGEEGVDGGLEAKEALEEGQRVGGQRVHGAVRGRVLHRVARDGHLELLQRRPCLPVMQCISACAGHHCPCMARYV